MQRLSATPRANWRDVVREQGLTWHSDDSGLYWDEGGYYSFSAAEIDRLETATNELERMCRQAIEHVLATDGFAAFHIPERYRDWIRRSYERDEPTIYGRFDFAFDGGTPKLLEYNADTPTALLEASVIQWFWFQEFAPGGRSPHGCSLDQFNSIHEQLIEAWKIAHPNRRQTLYFAAIDDDGEDITTVSYLRDTAIQAGLDTSYIEMSDLGWNTRNGFVDLQEAQVKSLFKLYPWEWLIHEEFGRHLLNARTQWIEPPWKMLLSNKALLPVLWELFPHSPYLLEASFQPMTGSYVRKPILSREGANVTIVQAGQTLAQTGGPYMGHCVYQAYQPLPCFNGAYPVVGSWVVNGKACGIGIREDASLVTSNNCRFVPHVFQV